MPRLVVVALLCCRAAGAQKAAKCEGPPELRTAITAEPSEEAYSALGFWFLDRGNLPCAISAFRSAVKLNGESVRARYNLGIALYESGDDEGAITHLKEAVRLAPSELNARQALDAAQLRLKRWTEAETAFRAALKLSPDSEIARDGLAAVQRQKESAKSPSPISLATQRMRIGDFAGAAEAWREYLRTTPDDAVARHNLAMALLKLGQRGEAEKELEESIRLKPDFSAAQTNLGVLYQQGGRTADAERLFRRDS